MTALWTPNAARVARTRITEFMHRLEATGHGPFNGDYFALHRWSVEQPELNIVAGGFFFFFFFLL